MLVVGLNPRLTSDIPDGGEANVIEQCKADALCIG